MLLHTSLWHSLVHIYNIAAIVNPFVMDIKHEPLLIFCIYCICQCVLQCYAKLRLPFILIALLCTGTWIRAAVHKWCICKGTVSPTWFQINIISLSARLIFFLNFQISPYYPYVRLAIYLGAECWPVYKLLYVIQHIYAISAFFLLNKKHKC